MSIISTLYRVTFAALTTVVTLTASVDANSQNYNQQAYSNAAYSQMAEDITCLETAGYWQTCTVTGWLKRDSSDNKATLFMTGRADEDGREITLEPSQAQILPIGQFVRVQAKVRNEDNRFVMLMFYGV